VLNGKYRYLVVGITDVPVFAYTQSATSSSEREDGREDTTSWFYVAKSDSRADTARIEDHRDCLAVPDAIWYVHSCFGETYGTHPMTRFGALGERAVFTSTDILEIFYILSLMQADEANRAAGTASQKPRLLCLTSAGSKSTE
jgi:hypothetical protein